MINTTNIFDYEDIQLIPNKCIVNSRSECDTSVKLGNRTFRLPVVPANMQTIIDEELAEKLARNNYFYIMHRFAPHTRLDFIKRMKEQGLFASISIGVKKEEFDFVDEIKAAGLSPEYITIDIAHGHSNSVIEMIQHIKKQLPESFVIAGNVGTPEAVRELENAGADATKVGIGPGKVCITKLKPVLVPAVGNYPLFVGAPKRLLNLLSLTAVSATMATLLNLFVSVPLSL